MSDPTRPDLKLTARGDEQAARESEARMAFILGYVKDPASDPAYADKPAVFKVVTDERTYQQGLATLHEATDVEAAATARKRAKMLFGLLKALTGVTGKTGGTEFEAEF